MTIRYRLSTVLWTITLVAVALSWFLDRRQLEKRHAMEVEQLKEEIQELIYDRHAMADTLTFIEQDSPELSPQNANIMRRLVKRLFER